MPKRVAYAKLRRSRSRLIALTTRTPQTCPRCGLRKGPRDPNEIDRRLARLFTLARRYVVTVEHHGHIYSCSSHSDLETATREYTKRLLEVADSEDIALTDQQTGEELRRSFGKEA